MQMRRITNDIAVYSSNVALLHGSNGDAVTVALAVRTHDISELHSSSACSQISVQCDLATQ